MKIPVSISLLLCVCVCGWAQAPQAAQPNPPDMATVRCAYQFVQKSKRNQQEASRTDTLLLYIGARSSCYYDPVKIARDSIYKAAVNSINPNTIQSISVLKDASNMPDTDFMPGDRTSSDIHDGESARLYKDYSSGTITVIDYDTPTYQFLYRYTDEIGPLAWEMSPETETILGYSCQKATVQFRGRSYEAWFAPEIPINDGPWKFSGLPGLILKVNDSEKLFSFICIGLEQLTDAWEIGFPQATYKDCSRKDLERLKRQAGKTTMVQNRGHIIFMSGKSDYPYLPIEL